MNNEMYYYWQDEQEKGPVTLPQIKDMVNKNILPSDVFFRAFNQTEWTQFVSGEAYFEVEEEKKEEEQIKETDEEKTGEKTKKNTVTITYPNDRSEEVEPDEVEKKIKEGTIKRYFKINVSDYDGDVENCPLFSSYYKPIEAYSNKLVWPLIITIFIIKIIEVFISVVNSGNDGLIMGLLLFILLFVVTIGLSFIEGLKNFKHFPAIAMFVGMKLISAEFHINMGAIFAFLFGAVVTSAIVAACYGTPIGLILGTLWSKIKLKDRIVAPDARPEGATPYIKGIVYPSIFLIIWIFVHIYILAPWLVKMATVK